MHSPRTSAASRPRPHTPTPPYVLALLLLAAPSRAATVGLTVTPPIVEIEVAAGGDRSFAVVVTNESDNEITARVTLAELSLDREGNPLTRPLSGPAGSISEWVGCDMKEVRLAPGEAQQVRCRVRVPAGQRGGRYGAVLFAMQQGGGPGTRLETRVGSVLMITAGRRPARRAEAADFLVRRDGKDVLFDVGLRNTGETHLRAIGELVLRDGAGRIAARLKLESGTGTVLPGGVRGFTARWSAQRAREAATYHAEIRFTVPGLPAVRASQDLTVEAAP